MKTLALQRFRMFAILALGCMGCLASASLRLYAGTLKSVSGPATLIVTGQKSRPLTPSDATNKLKIYDGDRIQASGEVVVRLRNGEDVPIRKSSKLISRTQTAQEALLQSRIEVVARSASKPRSFADGIYLVADVPMPARDFGFYLGPQWKGSVTAIVRDRDGRSLYRGEISPDARGYLTDPQLSAKLVMAQYDSEPRVLTIALEQGSLKAESQAVLMAGHEESILQRRLQNVTGEDACDVALRQARILMEARLFGNLVNRLTPFSADDPTAHRVLAALQARRLTP